MEEQRSALEISPERVYKIWNEWQLRGMVLLSLALQIGLIIFGNQRKRTTSNWVRGLVWLMYLSADSVAALSLGILSNSEQEDSTSSSGKSVNPHNVIAAVWASFLLLHLGGPDTITAYSLEDNDLWLRHLLGLVVQVVGAFYVFLRSQIHTHHLELMFLAIPIFIAGIIKYGERTWALRSASRMRLANALHQAPSIQDSRMIAFTKGRWYSKTRRECVRREDVIFGSYYLHEAFILYEFLRDAYGDVPLDKDDQDESYRILWGKSTEEAFQVVDIELGFLYDMIYTKAPIIWYNKFGFFLRIIAFLASISALLVFCLIIDRKPYSNIDTTITYLFVVGAVFLEIYSFILLIISDWGLIILSESKRSCARRIYRAISPSSYIVFTSKDHKIKWSGSMGQYNLFEFATENPTMFDAVLKRIGIYDVSLKNRYTTWEKMSTELKELVFQQLRESREKAQVLNDIVKISSWRGDEVLRKNGCFNKFDWSIVEVEFDYSIIVWHIATNICYDIDLARCQGDSNCLDSKCKMSKSLSDYMIYLLFVNPFMLPMENGLATFLESWVLIKFDPRRIYESIERNGRKTWKLVVSNISSGQGGNAALEDGFKLARGLQSLETDHEEEQRWTMGKKWEMISQLWVEMLCYAACHCEWKDHAKQLRRGGEFLTHVSLLMFHLGYTNGKSQIS